MKIRSALAMTALAVTFGMATFAGNGRGPAPKATGSVWFYAGEMGPWTYIAFNAHEEKNGRPAKGWLYYEEYDEDGMITDSFEAEVFCVDVMYSTGEETYDGATFAGDVYDDMGEVVTSVQVWVEDHGPPGQWDDMTDLIAFSVDDMDGCTGTPAEWYPVMAGNLKVH